MKSNHDLMIMMQLCEAKNCWLHELDAVPASELAYWIAYYEQQELERKRREKTK